MKSLGYYEVNRNWNIRAESPLAAALKVTLEEGGYENRYAYSVLDIRGSDVHKIWLGPDSKQKLEVTVCQAVVLPGGQYGRMMPGDTPMPGTETRWIIFPSVPGRLAMVSMREIMRDKARALARARALVSIFGIPKAPVLR